jgi:hypothetical protein
MSILLPYCPCSDHDITMHRQRETETATLELTFNTEDDLSMHKFWCSTCTLFIRMANTTWHTQLHLVRPATDFCSNVQDSKSNWDITIT